MSDIQKAEDFVKEVRQFQEHLNEAAENTSDVKEGRCTPEDEKNEPAFKLYNSIAETTIKTLQNDMVQKAMLVIGEKLGPDLLQAFVEVLTISMTYSAHEAVICYDEMLKAELTREFNNLGEIVNKTRATVQAHVGVLQGHRNKIQALENKNHVEGAGA